MKNIIKQSLLIYLLIIIVSSCKKQIIPAEQINLGKEYVKFETGHFIEYDVDSIRFNDFDKRIDSFKYELRDEVAETFYDNQNRLSYVINRFKRKDSTQIWVDESTYYITQTPFNLEWVQENLRFIKLIFPIKLNLSWNGNKYIPIDNDLYKSWNYKYTKVGETKNTGSKIYNNTITVFQQEEKIGSLIVNPVYDPNLYSGYTYSSETYAKNVGLVYKEITSWVNQTDKKFKNGFTLILRAKNNN